MRKTPLLGLILTAAALATTACSESENSRPTTTTGTESYQDVSTEYQLKGIGPGGGIIFHVAYKPFACGPDLSAQCRFLEVAPFADEVERPWAHDEHVDENVKDAEGSAIGTGLANTLAIVRQGNTDPAVSAAAYADAYEHNGYDDWYLPSRDELQELVIAREVIGGFTMETYWSSTERDGGRVWYQNFLNGFQFLDEKSTAYLVRPIRAF